MWSVDGVAERFREAAQTARRLPPVRVQGYFNTWPAILRQPWETYSGDDVLYRFPPDPAAIDRMEETMRWVRWLTAISSGCAPRNGGGGRSAGASAVTAPRLGGGGRRRSTSSPAV